MITPEKEEYVLTKAYIPEHIAGMMSLISKGEPCLIEDYIYFKKEDWVIFIGYPLERAFTKEHLEASLKEVIQKLKPEYTWFIAPEIPDSFIGSCQNRESDEYFRLNLEGLKIKGSLMRVVKKASRELSVEIEKAVSKEHEEAISEFLEKENPPPMIRQLFLSMRDYVSSSNTAVVLSARDKKKSLSAFYVIDTAANDFATYLIGCYSRKNYVPNASDLLCYEMIALAKEQGKDYISLGLGVNEGIRRFKRKWGGIPFLRYEFCEYHLKPPGIFEFIRQFKTRIMS